MIRKPAGVQQEARLHSAVGTVIRAGGEIGSAGRAAQRTARAVSLYIVFCMMALGLLGSVTPAWFKLAVAACGFQLFRWLKRNVARRAADG